MLFQGISWFQFISLISIILILYYGFVFLFFKKQSQVKETIKKKGDEMSVEEEELVTKADYTINTSSASSSDFAN